MGMRATRQNLRSILLWILPSDGAHFDRHSVYGCVQEANKNTDPSLVEFFLDNWLMIVVHGLKSRAEGFFLGFGCHSMLLQGKEP